MANEIYAAPCAPAIGECYFYHTADIPGHGYVEGQWDLRDGMKEYLGHVDLKGKRVLEMGTASGFVCFHMESQGADVVAYDLSENNSWDIVPFANLDYLHTKERCRKAVRTLNNGYWLCHRARQSRARVVHGSVYAIPDAIGPVDVATFCSILLHLRDPFLALATASRLTREIVIVTDLYRPTPVEKKPNLLQRILHRPKPTSTSSWAGIPVMGFAPTPQPKFDPESWEGWNTWWLLTPEIVIRFLAVLGFERVEVTFHSQKHLKKDVDLFTVVGHRTSESQSTNEFLKVVRENMLQG